MSRPTLTRHAASLQISMRQSVLTLVLALVALLVPADAQSTKPASSPRKGASQVAHKTPIRSSAEFNRLVRQATEARESEHIDEAIPLYTRALKLKPSWDEGWWYLGTMLYDRDRYSEAAEAFRRLAAIQPKRGAVWALLGLCEFQIREYERALIDLQRGRLLGIGDNPQLTSVSRYHAAILLARFEHFEQGYEALREFALEQNDNPNVIEAMGINVLRMPFLPSEVQPEKRELILMAGRAAYELAARHAENALVDFQELVARYPSTPNVHYAYGVFLVTSNPDAALEEFRRELQISPSHFAARLQLAFEYLKRGDPKTGLPYAEEAVELTPKLFAARNALGRILLDLGEVDRAIKELESGVKLAPDSPEMHFVLARAYTRAGRKEDAARERATFLHLDKIQRTHRSGAQSVGGLEAKRDAPPPK